MLISHQFISPAINHFMSFSHPRLASVILSVPTHILGRSNIEINSDNTCESIEGIASSQLKREFRALFSLHYWGKQHKIDKWHSFKKGGRHRVVTWKFFGMMWAAKILSMFNENMINFRHFLNSIASFSATSFRTSTRTCRLIA